MERALEWLRPLVDSKNWEYCVVWKLGDDPSRFIEWVGCCCSGANAVNAKENGGKQKFTTLCRDSKVQHHIRTRSCETLAHFPLSISLYSGIQGEVVTTNEPKWINYTDISNSNLSHYPWQELKGTVVLIPVAGGLVELYNSKLIYKDQKTIDFIINRFKLGSEEANCSKGCFSAQNQALNAFPQQYTDSPSSTPLISQVSESSAGPSCIQGSPACSHPSNELTLFHSPPSDHLSRNVPLSQPINGYFEHTELQCSGNLSKMEGTACPLNQEDYILGREILAVGKKRQREPYQSKNLFTERKRRTRIKDGLFALRALVPNISKMDKIAILGDSIDYIHELQETVRLYVAELNEITAEVLNNESAEVVLSDMSEMSKVAGQTNDNSNKASILSKSGSATPSHPSSDVMEPLAHFSSHLDHDITQVSVNTANRKRMEGQVEVNQIGAREFLLKVSGSHKPGGFTKLMEAMNYSGLEVVNVSFTTCGGEISSVFIGEANVDKVLEVQKLRSLLLESLSSE